VTRSAGAARGRKRSPRCENDVGSGWGCSRMVAGGGREPERVRSRMYGDPLWQRGG
jgi:hypothetical protein